MSEKNFLTIAKTNDERKKMNLSLELSKPGVSYDTASSVQR